MIDHRYAKVSWGSGIIISMGSPSFFVGSAVHNGDVPLRLLPDHLIAIGEPVADTERVSELVGLEPRSAYAGLSRLRRQGRMFSPARGLYVAVPPEYRSWGVVPAPWWIDQMMDHLGRDYYVGLLTAAAVHGAAHQAPQVFQVVVDQQLAGRDIHRVRVRFYVSSALSRLPAGTVERVTTETGSMAVSSRELTALDLATRPSLAGGLDNVATVLTELGDLDADVLATIGALYPRSAVRRLGWLLAEIVGMRQLEDLQRLAAPGTGNVTPLDTHAAPTGERNATWAVLVNTSVEPDT